MCSNIPAVTAYGVSISHWDDTIFQSWWFLSWFPWKRVVPFVVRFTMPSFLHSWLRVCNKSNTAVSAIVLSVLLAIVLSVLLAIVLSVFPAIVLSVRLAIFFFVCPPGHCIVCPSGHCIVCPSGLSLIYGFWLFLYFQTFLETNTCMYLFIFYFI
jgi:hypothetical protein